MKQRTVVRIVIQDHGGHILLVRRNANSSADAGKYELPGCRLDPGEQPEDTIKRCLVEHVKLTTKPASLTDAVTYIDPNDRDIQYTVLVYSVIAAGLRHKPELGEMYDNYSWVSLHNPQHYEQTDLTELLLGILRQQSDTDNQLQNETTLKDLITTDDTVIIYSDGGSRGNPGPSSAGYVIVGRNNNVVAQGGDYLGITTNNQAEYHGVRLGLERAFELGYKRIDFRIDSMLVVNQLNGTYRIKNRELWPVHERIRKLTKKFERVSFTHVHREKNQLADSVVNQVLDQQALVHSGV